MRNTRFSWELYFRSSTSFEIEGFLWPNNCRVESPESDSHHRTPFPQKEASLCQALEDGLIQIEECFAEKNGTF